MHEKDLILYWLLVTFFVSEMPNKSLSSMCEWIVRGYKSMYRYNPTRRKVIWYCLEDNYKTIFFSLENIYSEFTWHILDLKEESIFSFSFSLLSSFRFRFYFLVLLFFSRFVVNTFFVCSFFLSSPSSFLQSDPRQKSKNNSILTLAQFDYLYDNMAICSFNSQKLFT